MAFLLPLHTGLHLSTSIELVRKENTQTDFCKESRSTSWQNQKTSLRRLLSGQNIALSSSPEALKELNTAQRAKVKVFGGVKNNVSNLRNGESLLKELNDELI